jgi:hypothetical protein
VIATAGYASGIKVVFVESGLATHICSEISRNHRAAFIGKISFGYQDNRARLSAKRARKYKTEC